MTDRSDPPAELPLDGLTEQELAALIVRITDELSGRGTREGFAELLRIVAYAGQRVGDAARLVAESNSWSQVGEISGTSRQAAWERWRMY
ncbi:MAG: hypothetical protein WCP30_18215 [Mycobacteriaceae bacterium]